MSYNNSISIHLKRVIDDSYKIQFVTSLQEAVNNICNSNFGRKYFIITDNNVNKFYGKEFSNALKKSGLFFIVLPIPAGEEQKTRQTKELLENQLLRHKAGRDSVIIALGGGVVGDIAGFVASTLLRGVPYIQIPTTLLAQVDSSIGGKVAVDHPFGKNLIGAFYQPKRVYIAPSVLSTLSDSEFSNGMAEVIKYAAIMDKKLFLFLEQQSDKIQSRDTTSLLTIIKRCCQLKGGVVQKDEKENGLRRILNFGHTVGHAIESMMNFQLPHGQAVAIGMVTEAKISVASGFMDEKQLTRLVQLIKQYHLPTAIPTSLNLNKVFKATLTDKKAKDGIVHYTLLESIGKARVGEKLTHLQALALFKQ